MKQIITLVAFFAFLASGLSAFAADATPNYHVARIMTLGGSEGWDYMTIDSDTHRLYITRGSYVLVQDDHTGQIVGTITGLSGIHGVAIDKQSGRGYISNGASNTVTIFDLKTLQKIQDVPVGDGPDCITFDPSTHRVFTFNGRGHTATAIDTKTGKVLATIPLPGKPEFAAADGKGHIFDNIEDKSEVVEIDTKKLKLKNTWPMTPGDGPSGLALDRQNGLIFSVCHNQTMTVLDSAKGRMVTTLPIGNGPDACAFDPVTSMLFCPNGRDGTLTIYHETSPGNFDLVDTVVTRQGARTMALDENTHHVFVVTAAPEPDPAGSPASPHGGHSFFPGSFVVMDIAP